MSQFRCGLCGHHRIWHDINAADGEPLPMGVYGLCDYPSSLSSSPDGICGCIEWLDIRPDRHKEWANGHWHIDPIDKPDPMQ